MKKRHKIKYAIVSKILIFRIRYYSFILVRETKRTEKFGEKLNRMNTKVNAIETELTYIRQALHPEEQWDMRAEREMLKVKL